MKFWSTKIYATCWHQMSWITAALMAGCGGSVGAEAPPATAATVAAVVVPSDYKLVWSDEFDANGLPDASRWSYDTAMNKAGWYNREKQYYSGARPENAMTQDGKLIITARKEQLSTQADWGGQSYTSSRLITQGKAEWTYGFFEIRARLPCGKGTWPAIWMLGSQGNWPANGELDIMEQVGSDPTKVFSTVHTTSGSGSNGVGGEDHLTDMCTAFHNYQMLWTESDIRFAVDGKLHATYVNKGIGSGQWPFNAPQFLILNIAIGGDLGGPVDDSIFPVQMEVDYVRVYQKAK
jgi:beta-glucanase (GH16 family)